MSSKDKSSKRKGEEISKKKPIVEESSSESEEEVVQPKKKSKVVAAPAKAAPAKAVPAKKESSSSESSSESSEDEAPKKPAAKAAPAKAAPAKRPADSSSESDSASEEEDTTPAKKPRIDTAESNETPAENLKIFVTGLPWKATDAEVKDFFKGCGKIVSAEVPFDESGRSSGTAYVVFSKRSEVDSAIELNGQIWPGTERWLKIQEARASTPRSPGVPGVKPEGCNTVFIGNLPWDVDEDQIREIFSPCGEINRIRFATNPETGDFKGFGHVEFFDGNSTDAAVKLAGTDVNGRAIRVDYAPPRNRDSFGGGGGRDGGRGRGGSSPFGGRGRDGGRGRGGRDSGRGGGRGGGRGFNANKGTIPSGGAAGKKTTFDEE